MNKQDIKTILDLHPNLQDKLFCRGFYFTSGDIESQDYPFWGKWNVIRIEKYILAVSHLQSFFIQESSRGTLILVGHAYNPFNMMSSEQQILKSLLEKIDDYGFLEELNQLTGIFTLIFVSGNNVYFVGDPTCMQTVFYCKYKGNIHISSHTNLLGDLLNLEWDIYIRQLVNYKFFHLLGNALPGDLTQFANVKRLVPNHYVQYTDGTFNIKRFYWPSKQQVSIDEVVNSCSELIHNNMVLIAQKWQKPAISLTGGCDSKTTLACTNGLYNHFKYFSYSSSESEKIDSDAAHKIACSLGLEHKTYCISEDDSEYENSEIMRELLYWNCGGIIYSNPNDVRKRCLFMDTGDFDVEVKSWSSEIGRAYYSKRFNRRKSFGEVPSPRKCTTLYKFFLHNRALVRRTDKVFAEYLDLYFEQTENNPIEWQEQFFWEYRVPSWNGLVISGEHRTSFDITIPYNNRKLLELLLSVPIEERISDAAYSCIREKMNPDIDRTNISITNLKHTHRRAVLESIYYSLHSFIGRI